MGLVRPSYEQVRVLRRAALDAAGGHSSIGVQITLEVRLQAHTPSDRRWYHRALEQLVTVCYLACASASPVQLARRLSRKARSPS